MRSIFGRDQEVFFHSNVVDVVVVDMRFRQSAPVGDDDDDSGPSRRRPQPLFIARGPRGVSAAAGSEADGCC